MRESSVGKCLLESLGPELNPQNPHKKMGVAVHDCSPSAGAMETGRSMGHAEKSPPMAVRVCDSETKVDGT